MFQFTECRKCQQRSLALSSLITGRQFLKLQNCHVFSTTCGTAVYILQSARHRFFYHSVDTCLCRNTCHGNMFFTGSDTGLHDRVLPMGYSGYFDQPALITCRSGISRKFRHRISSMTVLIFLHTNTRNHFAFDHIFRIGNRTFFYGNTVAQNNRFFSKRSGNGKFIITKWCCRRLKTGSDLNCRIHTNTDRNRQFLSQSFRTLCHCSDMSCSRCKENG